MNLHTVYDFANQPLKLTFLYPMPFAFIGMLLFLYYKNLEKDFGWMIFGGKSKRMGMIYGIVCCLLPLVFAVLLAIGEIKMFYFTKDIYYHQKYSIIKGNIENFDQNPAIKNQAETFDVKGVHFEIMSYNIAEYGFNDTLSSVINPNTFVRIGYYNNGERNIIIKLEIK